MIYFVLWWLLCYVFVLNSYVYHKRPRPKSDSGKRCNAYDFEDGGGGYLVCFACEGHKAAEDGGSDKHKQSEFCECLGDRRIFHDFDDCSFDVLCFHCFACLVVRKYTGA